MIAAAGALQSMQKSSLSSIPPQDGEPAVGIRTGTFREPRSGHIFMRP